MGSLDTRNICFVVESAHLVGEEGWILCADGQPLPDNYNRAYIFPEKKEAQELADFFAARVPIANSMS